MKGLKVLIVVSIEGVANGPRERPEEAIDLALRGTVCGRSKNFCSLGSVDRLANGRLERQEAIDVALKLLPAGLDCGGKRHADPRLPRIQAAAKHWGI